MYPLLKEGDLVIVDDYPHGIFRRGSILVYKTEDGRHIIHRLVGNSKNGIMRLRGDGFNSQMEMVDRKCIMGVVRGIIRHEKFYSFTRSKELYSWGVSWIRRLFIRLRRYLLNGF
jgi:SOS-response transcriptional repressor LexA